MLSELAGALLGGVVIGASAALLLLFDGRIAGISGIVGGLVEPRRGDVVWRAAFVGGLLVGGVILATLHPAVFGAGAVAGPSTLVVAGLLVGIGTQVGNGCTSGHGVCGIGRGSPRSLAATVTFLLAGMLTVWLLRRFGMGVP